MKLTRQQEKLMGWLLGIAVGVAALIGLWSYRATAVAAPELVPVLPSPVPEVTVLVHVAGQVASPGVYELPAGSRVIDAVQMAGGATDAGDPDALNLAAPLLDGERVYVPLEGEVVSAGAGAAGGKVRVNTASETELQTLPGIGPALAGRIIAERQAGGPFQSVDDLTRVSGIGAKSIERLRPLVQVP